MAYSQNSDDENSRVKILKWILIAVIVLALIIILIIGISYYNVPDNETDNIPDAYLPPVNPGLNNNDNSSASPINLSSMENPVVADNLTAFDFDNGSAAKLPVISLGNNANSVSVFDVNNGSASNVPAFNPSSGDAAAVPGFDFGNSSAADVPSNIK